MKPLLLERDYLIADPWDQLSGGDTQTVSFHKTSLFKITLSVYGRIGRSDLTGLPIVEDMTICVGKDDISSGLPESFLQELEEQALENNSPEAP